MMTEEEFRVKMKELGWPDEFIESRIETIRKVEKLLGQKVNFEDNLEGHYVGGVDN